MSSFEPKESNNAAIAMSSNLGPVLQMPSLEILEHKNQWRTWAADVYIRLSVHGFQRYLFQEHNENATSNELRDARYTAAYLFCHCATNVKRQIRSITSAKTIWDELRGLFEKRANSTHINTDEEFDLMDSYCYLNRSLRTKTAAEYCDSFLHHAKVCERFEGAPSAAWSTMKLLQDLEDQPKLKEFIAVKYEEWRDTGNPPVLADLISDIKVHLDASTNTDD
ncbi:hypothetical protein NpNSSI1_00002090 [Neofusicoccum parvum]|uniref:Uncharacterized protein n=1 Tax=Botryosphaeria parva (strain UCR-NP2) TaxID=1287680 RepID=R1GAL9_BOTPV|nr:hypothetical protein UCRNP2_10402 [Neofusicoccum parvum UCRNP2]GME59795.1 hypothetical protein NpNSSI1_00002090 [Neofusicoccum parvum]